MALALQLRPPQAANRALELGRGGCLNIGGEIFTPQRCLGAPPRLVSVRLVDLLGPLGVIREDGHDVAVDLQEATRDEDALLLAMLTDAQLAHVQQRQQRRMVWQDAKPALASRRVDGLRLTVEDSL